MIAIPSPLPPSLHEHPVVCRPALPKDTPQVLELTRLFWDGHEYIPLVWEEWLADSEGLLAVAECGNKVVGTGKLTRLSEQDWWLEGLRVHPEYQGRGIAAHLNDYFQDVWLRHGNGNVRLATASTRVKVHHLCERSGFSKVSEITAFLAPILAEDVSTFSPIHEREVPEALKLALESPSLALSSGLMDLGWQWTQPRESHLVDAARRGRAWWWQSRAGLLVTWEDEEDNQKIPGISLAACQLEDLPALLLDFRRLAWKCGYQQAIWNAPLHPELLPELIACGFARDWAESMYIYARQHPAYIG